MTNRFEKFTVLINRISRNIRRIENREMSDFKLRGSHISCLYHLYTSKELTSTELCELCEEDKATISRSISFLEKEGYLTCESPNTKRYKSPLILTEKGISAGRKIAEKVERVLDEVGIGLTDEDRETLYRSLGIISENLERISDGFRKKL